MRTFRVDRIVALTLSDQGFEMPAGFDIHAYLNTEPPSQARIPVRLRFVPGARSTVLDDHSLWDTMEDQPDGSMIFTLATPNLDWATRLALGYGSEAVVLEPEDLRALVSARARAIAALYPEVSKRIDEEE